MQELDRRLLELIESLAADVRPDWVTDSIANITLHLVAALQTAAPVAEARFGHRPAIKINSDRIHRETWRTVPGGEGSPDVVVSGRLETVDLKSDKFRVVDDVGNRIVLEDVHEAESVAPLINHRVNATGTGVTDAHAKLKGVNNARIVAEVLPESWRQHRTGNLAAELAKPGPTYGGGIEVTDEEYADFLALIKG